MNAGKAKPLFTQDQEAIDEAFVEGEMGNLASSRGDRHILDSDNSWGNFVPPAHMKITHRQRRFAELMFLGISIKEASKTCGYTNEYASNLAKAPVIQKEIEAIRDKSFAKPVEERLRGMGTLALDTAEEILMDSDIDPIKKENILKWIIEMQIGKANQKVSVDGQIGIGVFLDKLDKLGATDVTPKARQITEAQVIDTTGESSETPTTQDSAEQDNFTQWLDKNL